MKARVSARMLFWYINFFFNIGEEKERFVYIGSCDKGVACVYWHTSSRRFTIDTASLRRNPYPVEVR